MTKHLNSFSYIVVFAPAKVAIVIGVLLFSGISFTFPSLLAFLAGIIGISGYYTYAFAMKREEASRIFCIASLYPAVVAILAAIMLNEIFSTRFYIGMVIMIIGAALISYKTSKFQKLIPVAIVLLAVIANIFYGVEQTISKVSLNSIDIWPFLATYFLGSLTATFLPLVVPSFRKDLVKEILKLNKRTIFLIESTASIWAVAIIFFYYAASLGPITLVSTIGLAVPFVVFLLTTILSKFRPKILLEEIDRKTLVIKLLAIILIFIGTWLIVV